MQESRRRSRLEQRLLPVAALLALACAKPAAAPGSAPASPGNGAAKSDDGSPALVPASGSSGGTASPAPERRGTANADTLTTHENIDAKSHDFPKNTLILHIGDSFAGSLGVPLGKRFKAAGMRTVLAFQTSSYVPTWASGKELPASVAKYHPSLVLITLGANEVEIVNPEQRAGAVRRLVEKLDGRPCVWITPPLWKPDTGIFEVIRQNAAPCRVLDSDTIVRDLPRQRDNIHPNEEGREIWADAVLAWLARERDGTPERPWRLRPEPRDDEERRADTPPSGAH